MPRSSKDCRIPLDYEFLYEQHVTLGKYADEISKETGYTKETIYDKLHKLNIPVSKKAQDIEKFKQALIGQRFGMLTVIGSERIDTGNRSTKFRILWICQCDCGKMKKVNARTDQLTKGTVTDCGCILKSKFGPNSIYWKGFGEIGSVCWSKIIDGAIKRGYLFDVTVEFAWNLFLEQNRKCALSGRQLVFAERRSKTSDTTASLDRINNDIGYVENNV